MKNGRNEYKTYVSVTYNDKNTILAECNDLMTV